MANSPQSKKRARQAERRAEINKARRSRMRTFVRKVEEAIAAGERDAAAEALRQAQPEIMRSVSKGVLHKNTASRKISRLAGRVNALLVTSGSFAGHVSPHEVHGRLHDGSEGLLLPEGTPDAAQARRAGLEAQLGAKVALFLPVVEAGGAAFREVPSTK